MIYGQDEAMIFPTMDLYDSGVMNMYIQAARDQYQQGLKDYEMFVSKYGDFTSPIAADVDYWNKNTMDPVMQTYNDLQAAGIDPVRSQEGRALMAKVTRNIPYAELAKRRQAAENARQYIKSREDLMKQGLWNEAYERELLGGQTLEQWDNSKGVWTATSAHPYKDLNSRYKHLFDGMMLSYDEEASKNTPGYLVKSKSKKDMRTILESNMVDLQQDPQFKYDLERVKESISQANPQMSEEDLTTKATDILKNEIIDRNHEASGTQVEVDPYYMNNVKYQQQKEMQERTFEQQKEMEQLRLNREAEIARIKNEGKGSRSGGSSANGTKYDHLGAQMQRGVENFVRINGSRDYKGTNPIVNAAMVAGQQFKADVLKANNKTFSQQAEEFVKKNTVKDQYGRGVIQAALAKDRNDVSKGVAGALYISASDIERLHSTDDIVSNMLGRHTKNAITTDRSRIQARYKDEDYVMEVTGDAITLPGSDYRMHQYVKVIISGNKKDEKGNLTDQPKEYWYELQRGIQNATIEGTVTDPKTKKKRRLIQFSWKNGEDFQYAPDPEQDGYYTAISKAVEKYLGNTKYDRSTDEVDDDLE